MSKDKKKADKPDNLFSKKNKVSAWISTHPYSEIPDAYFEEKFSKNNTRANNTWSDNYKIGYFIPDNIETNGSLDGMIDLERAAGECSFSSSFIEVVRSKARKKNVTDISWLILLYDVEYSLKTTGIEKDDYTLFLGAFDYTYDADSVYDIDESAIDVSPKLTEEEQA